MASNLTTVKSVKNSLLVLVTETVPLILDNHFDSDLLDLLVNDATLYVDFRVIVTLLNGILEENEKQLSKSAPVIPEKSHLNLLVDV